MSQSEPIVFSEKIEISREGERLFVSMVERSLQWVAQKRDSETDIGIDYMIELLENRSPVGRFLLAQIKTTEEKLLPCTSFHLYIRPEHMSYWRASTIPVILVFVSLADSTIWWRPIDEHLVATPTETKLRVDFLGAEHQLTSASKTALINFAMPPAVRRAWSIIDDAEQTISDVKTRKDAPNTDIVTYESWNYFFQHEAHQVIGAAQLLRDMHQRGSHEYNHLNKFIARFEEAKDFVSKIVAGDY